MNIATTITREVDVVQTPRLLQMSGIFDIPPAPKSTESWDVKLDLPDQWNVGVIVGPSGCGKTTIAREVFGNNIVQGWDWPDNKCVLDGFPVGMSIKDITGLLSSVGFSSPPSWVRPFRVLSNGQQFRVSLARTLAEMPDLAVVDEFSSVVDRTVAQIGSAAVQKAVRRRNQKFIAVTCHYDVVEWLEPDWVYEPHTGKLARGRLHRRPPIELEVIRVHSSAWSLFKQHHYLSADLHPAATCFGAVYKGQLVAFDAWLPFMGKLPNGMKGRRGHRTVCLPDFQGVGIGAALVHHNASLWAGLGYRVFSCTGHPAEIGARLRSGLWKMTRGPGLGRQDSCVRKGAKRLSNGKPIPVRMGERRSLDRMTASFVYIGPKMDRDKALQLLNG